LTREQAKELIAALSGAVSMRSLKSDHTYEIRLNPRTREVLGFHYRVSPVLAIEISRGADGRLSAATANEALDLVRVELGGKINSSLDQAMRNAGLTGAAVNRFVELFGWDVNWYVDPRKGDEFRLIAEKKLLQGKFYGFGRILAAEYRGQMGTRQVFAYPSTGDKVRYFTAAGRSIKRAYLKTPLHYRRISSRFNNRRFHPVLLRNKAHNGVDYAAARGTPVWAAADGIVVNASRSAGAGNMVVLRHAGRVATLYMHLDRFARGLKRGQQVKQRQPIGFVGSTGLATGPHLHFGMQVGGRYINPLEFKIPPGPMLPKSDRLRFLEATKSLRQMLAKIPLTVTDAVEEARSKTPDKSPAGGKQGRKQQTQQKAAR
jgi:murein DD-endopeptidase MepM/ murein hydrolase activator NlpD